MSILLIVCAIGVLIWLFLNQRKQSSNKGPVPIASSRFHHDIQKVGPGGVVKLRNIGPDMDEFDVSIQAKHIYREGESTWYELEGDNGDEKVWIDIEEDDELELTVRLKKLKLRDISLKKDDLERIDDDEEGKCQYNNQTFEYDDSGSAVFYRDGNDNLAETFYYWDFEANNGKNSISVERWSNGNIDVSYSEAIKLSQVEVFSLGSKEST